MAVIEVLNSAPRRRAGRRNRNKQVVAVAGTQRNQRSNNIVLATPSTVPIKYPTARLTQTRAPKLKSKPKLSQCGIDFLKCAFAVPDFDSTGSLGIPDNYVGRTLMSNQTTVQTFSAPAGNDSYLLVSPFFGSANFYASVPASGPVPMLDTVNWPGFSQLGLDLPPGGTGSVSKFRYAGLAAELQCTMNEMTWAGNITCYRIPMTMTVSAEIDGSLAPVLPYVPGGLTGLQKVPFNNVYTAPVNLGAYAVSFNRTGSFDFREVVADNIDPTAIPLYETGGGSGLKFPYRGHDELDTLVFKITVPTGASAQSFIFRTWACVELQVAPTTFIYEFASLSCPHEQLALDMYKYIAERLPIAVPYRENAKFWDRILSFIRSAATALSYAPGPVGGVATGVSMVMDNLAMLRL